MKATQIIALGLAGMFLLIGFGGCCYLEGLGRAAVQSAGKHDVTVNLPGLAKKQP